MAEQPPLIYQVAVGEVPPFYEKCVDSVSRYCRRHGFDHIVQRGPILRIRPVKSARSENALRLGYLPIFEKECAFAFRGRKVAVIDADVFIRAGAPDVFEGVECFGAVAERDMPLTPDYRTKIRKHSEGQFRSLSDVDWKWNADGAEFFNMGVMVLGLGFWDYLTQTPAEFLRRPEFERFVNGEGHWRWSTDQTLLNWWLKKDGVPVTRMDWKWNALFGAVHDVTPAYAVHFFLSAKQTGIDRAIAGL